MSALEALLPIESRISPGPIDIFGGEKKNDLVVDDSSNAFHGVHVW